MKISRPLFFAFSIFGLLAVTGCDSHWTEINVPSNIGPSQTFNVALTEASTPTAPLGGNTVGWVFSAVIPSDWTPSATGTYVGNWGGSVFNATANLVSAPPTSDLRQLYLNLLANQNPPGVEDPAISAAATLADCYQTQPVAPVGFKVVWYQVGPPTRDPAAVPAAQPGDGGTLNLQLTSGPVVNPATITFQHAVYIANFQSCTWNIVGGGASFPGAVTPDSISASIAPPGPIPALGSGMLALLATLIALVGVWSGRKRSQN